MVTFHVLNDIWVYRSNWWSYINWQEDSIQLFILSLIHLSGILFYNLEILWWIRQKMILFSGTSFIPMGHTVQHHRVTNAMQGIKTGWDDVWVVTLIWEARDTLKLKICTLRSWYPCTDLGEEGHSWAKSLCKVCRVGESSWVLGKKASIGWAQAQWVLALMTLEKILDGGLSSKLVLTVF